MRRTKVNYRAIYIKYNGDIPPGYHIHHKDGNNHNNHPDNLVALSPLNHALIHKKQGDVREYKLLMGKILGGGTSEYPYLGDIPIKDSVALYRMNHGLVKLPRRLAEKGVKEPEVKLMESMDHIIDDSEPYDNSKLEFATKLLRSLDDKEHAEIIDRFYGINYEKAKQEDIAIMFNKSHGAIRKIVERTLTKLKNKYGKMV